MADKLFVFDYAIIPTLDKSIIGHSLYFFLNKLFSLHKVGFILFSKHWFNSIFIVNVDMINNIFETQF